MFRIIKNRFLALSIQKKMFLSFGVGALLTIIASIVALYNFEQVKNQVEQITSDNLVKLTASMTLASQASDLTVFAAEMLLSENRDQLKSTTDKLRTRIALFKEEQVAILKKFINQEVFKDITVLSDKLVDNFNRLNSVLEYRNSLIDVQGQLYQKFRQTYNEFHLIILSIVTGLKTSNVKPAIKNNKSLSLNISLSDNRLYSMLELKSDANILASHVEMIKDHKDVASIKKAEEIAKGAAARIHYRANEIENKFIKTKIIDKFSELNSILVKNEMFNNQVSYIKLIGMANDLIKQNHSIVNELKSEVTLLVDNNKGVVKNSVHKADKSIVLSRVTLFLLSIISVLSAIILAWLFSGKLMGLRIKQLADTVRNISDGKLDAEIIITGKDEITDLERGVKEFRDISVERQQIHEKMSYLANFDTITGLPNRNLLYNRIGHAIATCKRNKNSFAVIFIDLDRFKIINDSKGHHVGDKLLQKVASMLGDVIRDSDTLARLGGDEFVILAEGIHDLQDATSIAQKIISTMNKTVHIDGYNFHVTGSVGVSLYPNDGLDDTTLLRNADTAMYKAKENGGNNVQFFSGEMNEQAENRFIMESSLRNALKYNEFEMWYQPKVSLVDKNIHSIEALVRWKRDGADYVSPMDFIPIAEECGLIHDIGEAIIDESCRACKYLHEKNIMNVSVAVNISPRQLSNLEGLESVISTALREYKLSPKYFHLELTESTLMENMINTSYFLQTLRDKGHKISLDDFGTGYSSLSYLRSLPVDELKIDKSFINEITLSNRKDEMVNAILAIGKILNLTTVAEGVETRQQFDYLRNHGCDLMQGYYFSKPLPLSQLATVMAA